MSHRALLVCALTLFVVVAGPAFAATIVVAPGPGTPLQDAIDAAQPKDTIRLLVGVYSESITIDKPLRLIGPRSSPHDGEALASTIHGGCSSAITILITADRVVMKRLRVRGATDANVDVVGADKVHVSDLFSVADCPAAAVTGVRLTQSTRTKVVRSVMRAPGQADDTGIHVDGAPANARNRIKGNLLTEQGRGLVIENSVSPRGVLASRNFANFSPGTGIVLLNAHGVQLAGNDAVNNGGNGIEVDALSSGNRLRRSTATGNDGTDVVDLGAGNCWQATTFVTGAVGCP